MYKLSWFEKIKYKLSELSYIQTLLFISFICLYKGFILRTFIIEPTKIYFEIDNNNSIILRIFETVLYYTLGYYTGLYIEIYKYKCAHFKNGFDIKFGGHLEWEKKGLREGLNKKGELSSGDIFSILIIEKFLNYPFDPLPLTKIQKEERIKTKNKMVASKDYFKLYLYIKTFTKYEIKHIETIKFIFKAIERYNNNKYYIQKSKERLEKYKTELIEYTWQPNRIISWCEPEIMSRWKSY